MFLIAALAFLAGLFMRYLVWIVGALVLLGVLVFWLVPATRSLWDRPPDAVAQRPQAQATPAQPTPTGGKGVTPGGPAPAAPGPGVQADGCPPAEQIGPWAPSASGEGETFEVTASRGPVHLSAWWPHGRTPWGQAEVSTVLEPGTSIEAHNGAGTAWDYPEECARPEFDRQVEKYRSVRPRDTRFHGAVALDELMRLGLVRERRPRIALQTQSQSGTGGTPGTTSQASAQCGDGVPETRQPKGGQTWTPQGEWRIVNFWSNEPGANQRERKLFLRPGENPALRGGGSSWSWLANCETVAREHFAKNSLPEVTLDQLRSERLVR